MAQLEHPGMEDLTRFAMETVRRAGDEALRFYGKGDPETKFDYELVTEAELCIADFFGEQLRSRFPDHGIFGVSSPEKNYIHGARGYLWIYDALDGIANFQAGIPVWGISMALLDNYWPIFGVFYMPVTGDIFYANAGQKAYWGNEVIRIPDPGEINNESVLLTYSRFHNHYKSTFPGKIRNLGSTAAHICYVARGRAEGALLSHVSYQDLAAAQIILKAAGGQIYKMDGTEFYLGEYVEGQRIDENLLAAPAGAQSSILMYIEDLD
ncbi:MAG: inositol monophosphatase family protein [Syntrophobacteraceae bacterium]